MLIQSFPAGPWATNCYVIANEKDSECLIIDPGFESIQEIRQICNKFNLHPVATLLTHGHMDHVWSVVPLCSGHNISSFIHPKDEWMLSTPEKAYSKSSWQELINLNGSVPKFLPDASGNPGQRNSIFCGAIEHKMGIHGNATCQMNLENATGWLIGEPHRGLNAMFVMMNAARLGVGMQSLGLTEVAYQNALIYARDRTQGRSLTGPKAETQSADPIIVHPDVRRMLLTARAYAEGGRAFTSYIALMIDRELNHPDEEVRKLAADEVALPTPVVKAFLTDNAWIATSEALQVYGGHG